MSPVQAQLAGGEGTCGVYGTLVVCDAVKVIKLMQDSCGLKHDSRLLDVGAGLGRWGCTGQRPCCAVVADTYATCRHSHLSGVCQYCFTAYISL